MTRPRKGGRKIPIKERELLSHICDLVVPHYSWFNEGFDAIDGVSPDVA